MNNQKWSTIVGKDVEAKTSEETIKLAGLDWQVQQSPISYQVEGGARQVNDRVMNYRSDTGNPLGIVGSGYQILQNSKMFNFLDSVVGSSEAMYVNAGSFKGGRKVYIQAKLPGFIKFDDGEDVGEKYLTFISSHDGSLGNSVLFTPIRVICQNTLVRALQSDDHRTNIRHTLSMEINLNQAKAALNLVSGQVAILEQLSRKLIGTKFQDKQMTELLEKSGMIPAEEKKSGRANNIIAEVLERFHYGKGSEFKTSKGTAWGAYNAVSEYVDHFRGSNPEKRAESLLMGSGMAIKNKTLELLAA
jgi:phage/plasmid-like protein (TIGR03299 family)